MPDQVVIEKLAEGVAEWNRWRRESQSPTAQLDLRSADLDEAQLAGVDFSYVNLANANLRGANLVGADLSLAVLHSAKMQKVDLTKAKVDRAAFNDTLLQGAKLVDCSCRLTSFSNTFMEDVDFSGADLSFATFDGDYHNIHLDGKAKFETVRLKQIDAARREWDQTIQIPKRDSLLNWGRLRSIGEFPLFGVSWTAFITSVLTVTAIGFVNEHRPVEVLQYPIPIPARMTLLIVSSLLLVIGSTLYRLMCPKRVQHFSETAWVEEHQYGRLHYLGESLKRRGQWLTATATVIGGALALYLAIDRLWAAAKIIAQWKG